MRELYTHIAIAVFCMAILASAVAWGSEPPARRCLSDEQINRLLRAHQQDMADAYNDGIRQLITTCIQREAVQVGDTVITCRRSQP
ncbi:hypothetical protein AN401_07085 [Zobellella denitrificans]|uniref:Uncharacterized protein n=1 Tax=Zobellella denitrificans TaxID=347534 RepID=A0A291HNJ2_9GAMM|nr:hypothetical protein [Zobellella denitrificans]ATG73648.1 hypothetical protein AN401_07085 [Zobellella denitrificans]